MADKKRKGLFGIFDGAEEKTVGTTYRGGSSGKSVWVFGRSPQCDVVCSGAKVSREHCRIELIEGHFYISDMGSTNGTYLNGKRIHRLERLFSGDVIGIGDTDIVFSKNMLK